MSLQKLSTEIESDAQNRQNEIVQETENQIQTLETEYNSKYSKFETNLLAEHNSEKNLLQNKLESKYTKLCKEQELNAKTQIINKLKQTCLKDLSNLDKTAKEQLFKKLFSLAKSMIKYETIQINPSDKNLIQPLTTEKTQIKTNSKINGIIFETSSGLEKLDLTFENLLDHIYSESEANIQKILFH